MSKLPNLKISKNQLFFFLLKISVSVVLQHAVLTFPLFPPRLWRNIRTMQQRYPDGRQGLTPLFGKGTHRRSLYIILTYLSINIHLLIIYIQSYVYIYIYISYRQVPEGLAWWALWYRLRIILKVLRMVAGSQLCRTCTWTILPA